MGCGASASQVQPGEDGIAGSGGGGTRRRGKKGSADDIKEENIVVAVRLRPYNDREKELVKNGKSKLCVQMPAGGQKVVLEDPSTGKSKDFEFDYAYWSHDKKGGDFVDQAMVMRDLGTRFLNNVFAGFNVSLFAYGQTGAGKSYTMTGTKSDPGILPKGCLELFKRIKEATSKTETFEVRVSYLEIYNEQVRDLLSEDARSLKVRENPSTGFYVECLTTHTVGSYKEIEKYMAVGENNRTTAATMMNAESSRSHSIFGINFSKITAVKGPEGEYDDVLASEINLVDLAGSERSDKTGAKGLRLSEANNINKSLTTLGLVISALADNRDANHIPYRNSQLTKLLRNSLGGNAKTIMVAAISPSQDSYEETMSTLRYAWRVKSIKTVAVKNKVYSKAQIKAAFKELARLRKENAALKKQLANGGSKACAIM